MIPPGLERGDPITVYWEDICDDVTGDPSNPSPVHRKTIAHFWSLITIKERPYLVTTSTMDSDISDQSGYSIYPIGTIIKVTPFKKRRPRKPKDETPPSTT